MQERLPSVAQVSSVGSTECGGFVSMGRPGDPLEVRLTTNGRAFPGSELRIVDPETGEDVPPDTPGEILMRGPTRFVRYHEEPELTAAVIDEDGWFHSGDVAVAEDGRLTFVGRLKDMLKVGGENVSAAEVESFLLGHPAWGSSRSWPRRTPATWRWRRRSSSSRRGARRRSRSSSTSASGGSRRSGCRATSAS